MTHAEKCPVCEGMGEVEAAPSGGICHGCEGLGWVRGDGQPLELGARCIVGGRLKMFVRWDKSN